VRKLWTEQQFASEGALLFAKFGICECGCQKELYPISLKEDEILKMTEMTQSILGVSADVLA
jgi:hypothetical protein